MKKVLSIILIALLVTAVFVSCDDPKHEEPSDETAIIHVSSLSDVATALGVTADFAYNSKSTDKIEIDGNNKYIVDEWQDLWFGGDVTIKNVTFAKGISLTTRTTNEVTVNIEGCTIYPCNQTELLAKVDADKNFRIDNSGNGLCLNIDAQNTDEWKTNRKGKITVVISNCNLIGDGSDTAVKTDSWPTTSDYLNNKNNSTNYSNYKGRGYGVGLGVASGDGNFLKKVTVTGCTFTNLRNNALQLSDNITAEVEVSNCKFNSWGVNKDKKGCAIRGTAEKSSSASITITDCTFDSASLSKHSENMKCEIDNLLKDTDVATWTQNGDKWSISAKVSTN